MRDTVAREIIAEQVDVNFTLFLMLSPKTGSVTPFVRMHQGKHKRSGIAPMLEGCEQSTATLNPQPV